MKIEAERPCDKGIGSSAVKADHAVNATSINQYGLKYLTDDGVVVKAGPSKLNRFGRLFAALMKLNAYQNLILIPVLMYSRFLRRFSVPSRPGLRPIITFLLLIASPLQATDSFFAFEPGELNVLKEISQRILGRVPPTEYWYVALGRSPLPLIPLMARYSDSPITVALLPGSNWRALPEEAELSPTHGDALDHWNRAFAPPLESLGGRKIAILDHGIGSGLSVLRARDALRSTWEQAGSHTPIEWVSVVYSGSLPFRLMNPGLSHGHVVFYSDGTQFTRFTLSRYDALSPNTGIDVSEEKNLDPSRVPRDLPEFDNFQKAVQAASQTGRTCREQLRYFTGFSEW